MCPGPLYLRPNDVIESLGLEPSLRAGSLYVCGIMSPGSLYLGISHMTSLGADSPRSGADVVEKLRSYAYWDWKPNVKAMGRNCPYIINRVIYSITVLYRCKQEDIGSKISKIYQF